MAAYTTIADTTDDQDSPITVSLARAWKNNPIAIAENDQSGDTPPIIVPAALQSVGFSARRGSTTTTAATLTTVVFDSEDYDLGGNYNNSTGVFTVGTGYAGLYMYLVTISMENNLDRVSTGVVYKNGSTILSTTRYSHHVTDDENGLISLCGSAILSETDNLRVAISSNGGNILADSVFSAVLISRGTLT